MLQVYDRVISSASQVTLVMLTIVLLVAFVALAGLDVVRARVLTRASVRLDRLLAGRVLAATMRGRHQGRRRRRASCCAISTPSASSLPAPASTPSSICPGRRSTSWSSSCCIRLLGAVRAASRRSRWSSWRVLGQWRVQGPIAEANEAASRNYAFTDMSLRNAEVVQAMGMMPGLLQALEPRPQPRARAAGPRQRPRGQHASMHPLPAALDAVAHPRARRLSGDRAAGHGRRHVCRQHPARPRPAAGRADRRRLAQT